MTYEKDFDCIFEMMIENAGKLFTKTDLCRDLCKRAEKAEKELEERFSDEDYTYIMEKADKLISVSSNESVFLYKQGFLDCVSLLKELGVLNK